MEFFAKCLIFISIFAAGNCIYVHDDPEHFTANLGEDVLLPCVAFEFPEDKPDIYTIRWLKQGKLIHLYHGYPLHARDEGRVSLAHQTSLNLTDVQESDQGWYECEVYLPSSLPQDSPNGTWVYLDVHASKRPYFINRPLPMQAVVPLNAPRGTTIFKLQARDSDVNHGIHYYMTRDRTGGRFEVDETSGEVRTRDSDAFLLDKEYVIFVEAFCMTEDGQEQSTGEERLSIMGGKRPPQFYMQKYEATIPKNQKTDVGIIKINAKSFADREIRYILRAQGRGAGTFQIEPTTGVVKLAKNLDDAQKTYFLIVTATEDFNSRSSGASSTNIELIIKVTDVDDNATRFEQPDYQMQNVNDDVAVGTSILEEPERQRIMHLIPPNEGPPYFMNSPLPMQAVVPLNATPGTPVFKLEAIDPDVVHDMHYFMTRDRTGGRFEVDERSGEVRTLGSDPFMPDKEYVLYVKAQDHNGMTEDGRYQSTGEERLSIMGGKRPPQFYSLHYDAVIPKYQRTDEGIIKVKAKSFADREIRYILRAQGRGGTFKIDPTTGVVKLVKDLGNENLRLPKQYWLIVTATEDFDSWWKSGSSSTHVQLIIKVTDEPRFEQTDYHTTIPQIDAHNVEDDVTVGTSTVQGYIQDDPKYFSANLGEGVILRCAFEYPENKPGPYIIQWQKQGIKIPIYTWSDGYPPHVGDGYEGRVSIAHQASLNLTNVHWRDQGWYECKVYFLNKPPNYRENGTWVHLDVHETLDSEASVSQILQETLDSEANVSQILQGTLDSDRNISQILLDTNCSCEWRYYKHYEAKGCTLEAADSCGCPQKFICSINQTQLTSVKVCVHQNKEYKVGSKIVSSDGCKVCRCREGTPPYISCATRECPQLEDKPGKDCHQVYKDNNCCPHSIECLDDGTEISNNKTCEYDGRYYPLGSKIYPADDPCQICVCDENWNGVDNSSCYQVDCMFERNKAGLNAGCIPVYHEKRCCPIEFYCPSSNNLSYSILSSNDTDSYNVSDDNQCSFDGQLYNIGDERLINNPCVKCSCVVPPDFTCVHQTCSSPPSNENCYAVVTAGECCPSYECMLGDAEPVADGCPTPLCADSSCRIETPPGHECPTCVCDERFSELEHNNLEQVQQVSQNVEQYELFQQQALDPGADESSEDELQMMPIRMQDSEQSPISEKMVMPDDNQYDEILQELLENSFEDNSSTNAVSNISEVLINKEENATSMTELELNEIYNESISVQSGKNLQKRSGVWGSASNQQSEIAAVVPENSSEHNEQEGNDEYIEREGGDSETNGDFDDELESFKKKILESNRTVINEITKIDHEIKVPPGCPTPMCEGPWCKIGIRSGGKCPTCICKRHIDVEP